MIAAKEIIKNYKNNFTAAHLLALATKCAGQVIWMSLNRKSLVKYMHSSQKKSISGVRRCRPSSNWVRVLDSKKLFSER